MENFKLKKLGTYLDNTDNSIKSVFENDKHNIIEMTLLQNRKERDVVCVPTHYFCRMGCKFCHLTNFFSDKLMTKIPVDEFNEALVRTLCIESDGNVIRRTYKKDILISFMGVGEPLLNVELIENVFKSDICRTYLNYENSSYALATMFPDVKYFKQLTETVKENRIPLKIHYSLHHPVDKERLEMIPKSYNHSKVIFKYLKKYRNDMLSEEFKDVQTEFLKFHHGLDFIEIHYTLINDANDSYDCLTRIKKICKMNEFPIKFITFNEVGDMKRSKMYDFWMRELKDENIKVKIYSPPGRNIGSSCGEFTKHYFMNTETDSEKEQFKIWKEKYEITDCIKHINDFK